MRIKSLDHVGIRVMNFDIAIGFYEKLGFKVVRTYVTPEGRCMNEFIIDIEAWAPLLSEQ